MIGSVPKANKTMDIHFSSKTCQTLLIRESFFLVFSLVDVTQLLDATNLIRNTPLFMFILVITYTFTLTILLIYLQKAI